MSEYPNIKAWRDYEKRREEGVQEMADIIRIAAKDNQCSNAEAAKNIEPMIVGGSWWPLLLRDGLQRANMDDWLESL